MLDQNSTWDLVAGNDKEYEEKNRTVGLPPNTIMTYMLEKEIFLDIINQYPRIRSFLVTRSLVRRAHFIKTFEDNRQVVLLKMKMAEHREMQDAKGLPSEYDEPPEDVVDPS